MLTPENIRHFSNAVRTPTPEIAPAALLLAKLEYSTLDIRPYLNQLEQLGAEASERVSSLSDTADPLAKATAISSFLFQEKGFHGNTDSYDDLRNSFLNEVLDRRTGIPITLAVVYIEIARRAGIVIDGVNFPGHFLLKVPSHPDAPTNDYQHVVMDPFRGGKVLSEVDCQNLLRKHTGEEQTFDQRLLAPATKQDILLRMLTNLKRIYVRMRSFPQAHTITNMLLTLKPSAMTELRDRGLLAYQLNNFPAALEDLESYLRFSSHTEPAMSRRGETDGNTNERTEQDEIWEHVKALRRRVASLN
mgnify:FL=1